MSSSGLFSTFCGKVENNVAASCHAGSWAPGAHDVIAVPAPFSLGQLGQARALRFWILKDPKATICTFKKGTQSNRSPKEAAPVKGGSTSPP